MAIALMVRGYSCRRVERELRRRFPGQGVPHYTTIARWLRETTTLPYQRSALNRWWAVVQRTGELVEDSLDEMEHLPLMDVVKLHSRSVDTVLALTRELS